MQNHTNTKYMFINVKWHLNVWFSMLFIGSEADAAIQCPDEFLASFDNYTIDMQGGSGPQCGGSGYATTCNTYKNVEVNYNVCADKIFYSCELFFII